MSSIHESPSTLQRKVYRIYYFTDDEMEAGRLRLNTFQLGANRGDVKQGKYIKKTGFYAFIKQVRAVHFKTGVTALLFLIGPS